MEARGTPGVPILLCARSGSGATNNTDANRIFRSCSDSGRPSEQMGTETTVQFLPSRVPSTFYQNAATLRVLSRYSQLPTVEISRKQSSIKSGCYALCFSWYSR